MTLKLISITAIPKGTLNALFVVGEKIEARPVLAYGLYEHRDEVTEERFRYAIPMVFDPDANTLYSTDDYADFACCVAAGGFSVESAEHGWPKFVKEKVDDARKRIEIKAPPIKHSRSTQDAVENVE